MSVNWCTKITNRERTPMELFEELEKHFDDDQNLVQFSPLYVVRDESLWGDTTFTVYRTYTDSEDSVNFRLRKITGFFGKPKYQFEISHMGKDGEWKWNPISKVPANLVDGQYPFTRSSDLAHYSILFSIDCAE